MIAVGDDGLRFIGEGPPQPAAADGGREEVERVVTAGTGEDEQPEPVGARIRVGKRREIPRLAQRLARSLVH